MRIDFGYVVCLDDKFAGGFRKSSRDDAVAYCLLLLKAEAGRVTINGVKAMLPDRPITTEGLLLWWEVEAGRKAG